MKQGKKRQRVQPIESLILNPKKTNSRLSILSPVTCPFPSIEKDTSTPLYSQP